LTQNPKTDTEEIRGKLGQKSGRGDEDDAQVPFSEADMNKAGYAALAAGKLSDAIIAFEMNATQYIVVERVGQLVRSVASGHHPIYAISRSRLGETRSLTIALCGSVLL
jgi:hypothetical protein